MLHRFLDDLVPARAGSLLFLAVFILPVLILVLVLALLVPVLALAAFFESYITRLYNDMSWLTTGIFSLSALFVIFYFIIYPIYLGRKMSHKLTEEEV